MTSLHLGDSAPDFTADTTAGKISFLDWKGDSWVVFFSHPADYTPVCTTELGRVAQLQSEWDKRGTKVIALSVDSVEDHRAWKPDIEEVSSTTVAYPIIADPDKVVAELYDMIHPGEGDSSSVRSVFIISPTNKIRLILTYPKSTGRNFDEVLRVLDAGRSPPRSTGSRATGRSSATTSRPATPRRCSRTSTSSSRTCASPARPLPDSDVRWPPPTPFTQ
jgi:alkyl hydroperoxide reductase subunit AhpC